MAACPALEASSRCEICKCDQWGGRVAVLGQPASRCRWWAPGGPAVSRSNRSALTYSNVTATLALFIALGGASYAATQLPRNSVGSAQIKNNGVANMDIANNAVTGAKVRTGSLDGS